MLLGRAPAAPHQKRDHAHGGRAAKHPRGGGEEPVNVALPFRERDGRWKWSHLFISDLTQAIPTPFAEIRGLSDVSDSCLQRFPDSPIRFASHPIKERLIGWAALGEAEISLALERLEGAQQHGLTAGSLLVAPTRANRGRRAADLQEGIQRGQRLRPDPPSGTRSG